MTSSKKNDGEFGFGAEISSFNRGPNSIEIYREGDGVHYFEVVSGDEDLLNEDTEAESFLAQALASWREVTKAKIISVVGFPGNEKRAPRLMVITEPGSVKDPESSTEEQS